METGFIKRGRKFFLTALVYELFGTCILTMSYLVGSYPIAASAYFVLWILGSTTSGAHFNPAISLCIFLLQKSRTEYMAYFILLLVFQLVGSFFGILLSYILMKPDFGSVPFLYP